MALRGMVFPYSDVEAPARLAYVNASTAKQDLINHTAYALDKHNWWTIVQLFVLLVGVPTLVHLPIQGTNADNFMGAEKTTSTECLATTFFILWLTLCTHGITTGLTCPGLAESHHSLLAFLVRTTQPLKWIGKDSRQLVAALPGCKCSGTWDAEKTSEALPSDTWKRYFSWPVLSEH